MTNEDARRIKEIRDNTKRIGDALSRIAIALERLVSETKKTKSRKMCDTCIHKDEPWHSEACDGCCKAHSNYAKDESDDKTETDSI